MTDLNPTKAERLQKLICDSKGISISECEKILDELDKPELDPQHKEILQSLMDGKGCVFKLKGYWRYIAIKGRSDLGGSRTCCEEVITEMIDLGLFYNHSAGRDTGMTHYVNVSHDGERALQE